MSVAKSKVKDNMFPEFVVYGHFSKTHSEQKIELWKGRARTVSVAMGRAIRQIMRRPNVKGLHHNHVSFTLYRSTTNEGSQHVSR